jgi:hypothetical protein
MKIKIKIKDIIHDFLIDPWFSIYYLLSWCLVLIIITSGIFSLIRYW